MPAFLVNRTSSSLLASFLMVSCCLIAGAAQCADRTADANWCRAPQVDAKSDSTALSLPLGPLYQQINFAFANSTPALDKPFSLALFTDGPPIVGGYSTSAPHDIPKEAKGEPAPSADGATTYFQLWFKEDWCTYSYKLSRACDSGNHCTYKRSQYALAPGAK